MAPTIADIETARERLAGVARETPLYPSETFSRLSGRQVFLKAENLQRTGSFKIRGAFNTIATLGKEERRAGVVAASAGNHGQAVAWAAREAGIPAIDLHAAGRADGEGRGDALVRWRDGAHGRRLRGGGDGRAGVRRPDGRDARARVRGRAGDRGTGDDRPRARRAGARGGDGAHPRSAVAASLRGSRSRSRRGGRTCARSA